MTQRSRNDFIRRSYVYDLIETRPKYTHTYEKNFRRTMREEGPRLLSKLYSREGGTKKLKNLKIAIDQLHQLEEAAISGYGAMGREQFANLLLSLNDPNNAVRRINERLEEELRRIFHLSPSVEGYPTITKSAMGKWTIRKVADTPYKNQKRYPGSREVSTKVAEGTDFSSIERAFKNFVEPAYKEWEAEYKDIDKKIINLTSLISGLVDDGALTESANILVSRVQELFAGVSKGYNGKMEKADSGKLEEIYLDAMRKRTGLFNDAKGLWFELGFQAMVNQSLGQVKDFAVSVPQWTSQSKEKSPSRPKTNVMIVNTKLGQPKIGFSLKSYKQTTFKIHQAGWDTLVKRLEDEQGNSGPAGYATYLMSNLHFDPSVIEVVQKILMSFPHIYFIGNTGKDLSSQMDSVRPMFFMAKVGKDYIFYPFSVILEAIYENELSNPLSLSKYTGSYDPIDVIGPTEIVSINGETIERRGKWLYAKKYAAARRNKEWNYQILSGDSQVIAKSAYVYEGHARAMKEDSRITFKGKLLLDGKIRARAEEWFKRFTTL